MTLSHKTSAPIAFADLPRNYHALTANFPLRPLHDSVDLHNATEILDAMAMHHERFSRDQADYFDVLASLVESYEALNDPLRIPHAKPLDAIRDLLAAHNLSASDLGRILGNRALGSKILRGDRKLTVNHIKKLSRYFRLDPALFI
jgi:HTH-type transcriptional regulator/antitoxin HigA